MRELPISLWMDLQARHPRAFRSKRGFSNSRHVSPIADWLLFRLIIGPWWVIVAKKPSGRGFAWETVMASGSRTRSAPMREGGCGCG